GRCGWITSFLRSHCPSHEGRLPNVDHWPAATLCSVLRERSVAPPSGGASLRLLAPGRSTPPSLENFIASTSIFVLQATKSQRWMPWRLKPMKDVGGCDKPRGAADRASIRGCPNGETRHPSWGVTPV